MIICLVVSLWICVFNREVFEDEMPLIFIGTWWTIAGMFFLTVMIIRYALHLIF